MTGVSDFLAGLILLVVGYGVGVTSGILFEKARAKLKASLK